MLTQNSFRFKCFVRVLQLVPKLVFGRFLSHNFVPSQFRSVSEQISNHLLLLLLLLLLLFLPPSSFRLCRLRVESLCLPFLLLHRLLSPAFPVCHPSVYFLILSLSRSLSVARSSSPALHPFILPALLSSTPDLFSSPCFSLSTSATI